MTTTMDTLNSRMVGLELHTLPQTIRDAVTITRGLGIRYLWVDVLCIIQDDKKDKTAEINSMGSIFKNASLTIVAAIARIVQDGFLRIPECHLRFLLPSGDFANASLTLTNTPINYRAWTFQEEVLSPRILYFGNMMGVCIYCQAGTRYYNGYTFKYTGTLDFPVSLPHSVFTWRKF